MKPCPGTPWGFWPYGVFFILAASSSTAHLRDGAIIRMAADGTGMTMTAAGPGTVSDPTWGSDGRLAYLSVPDTAGHRHPGALIGIIEEHAGIQMIPISEALRGIRSLAFHGNRLAFVAQAPGSEAVSDNDLYVIDVVDGITANLTDGLIPYIAMPSWSPSGEHIAFTAGIGDDWLLHVWETDGLAGMPDYTSHLGAEFVLNAAWSPDGTQFALQLIRDDNSEIFVMSTTGTDAVNITNHPAYDQDPAWSPDGQELVFVSDRGGLESIYRMRADGTDVRQLTDDQGIDLQPHWSAKGICFVSDRNIE